MKQTPFEWRRGPRSSFALGAESGVYALFLRDGAVLPDIEPGPNGLIYIGLAANRNGLSGRCHFNARTRNHSPRKSLAVLLMEKLSLTPVLITKPSSSDTWGLDMSSEARLTAWMHTNLDLAIEVCPDPNSRESELIERYAPPLNLTKCVQTARHRRISQARAIIMAELRGLWDPTLSDDPDPERTNVIAASADSSHQLSRQSSHLARQIVGADIDTAEAIAARYGLNPKSYRQRLRDTMLWYHKPQDWTFPADTDEWRDMIATAEKMTVRI